LSGPIEAYMQADHQRLDALRQAGAWWEFRGGLLRHIGLEEKILLPDARRRSGAPLQEAARLREDHGLLATLLVPPFSPEIGAAIDRLLLPHNAVEEGPGGVYARCDALAGADAEAVAARLRSAPQTPQRPHQEGPQVRAQVERALQAIAARGL
jgi:hypothetical protein